MANLKDTLTLVEQKLSITTYTLNNNSFNTHNTVVQWRG